MGSLTHSLTSLITFYRGGVECVINEVKFWGQVYGKAKVLEESIMNLSIVASIRF